MWSERAFDQFFSENYTRIYSLIFRFVGNRLDAEDLTLEAFWRVWNLRSNSDQNLLGWLYRVGTRLGYNALRSWKRRVRYEQEAGEFASSRHEEIRVDLQLEQSRERDRVRSVLAKLPARSAQVLLLRYSGLAYKEIASAIGVSPASVGTLLIRAEKQFETLYKEGVNHASERSFSSRVPG